MFDIDLAIRFAAGMAVFMGASDLRRIIIPVTLILFAAAAVGSWLA